MTPSRVTRPAVAGMVLLTGLSLSIGWGIRGNFGHAYGAMIPGALAAMAVIILAGREDWWRRVAYFAMFGALGWAFGGTISYMQVIAYTHSGHLASQLYGYACLFVIGFLWAALGGAATALPACLEREKLTGVFIPILTVLTAWLLQGILVPLWTIIPDGNRRHESALYWYDTSWLAVLVAQVAVLLLAAVRRRICWGTSLILHLTIGWWVAFLLMVMLVDGFGIEFRMTPPRGDNWVGVLGMAAGALIFLLRHHMIAAARAMLVCGFFGGFGFATATFLKLVEVRFVPGLLSAWFGSGSWQTNWHSILEQTYGLFNGMGLAFAMAGLARRVPRIANEPRTGRWTEVVAIAFVLLLVTYLNLAKNVPNWVQLKAVPAMLYGVPSRTWFNLVYGGLAAAIVCLLFRHLGSRLALIPPSALGRSQLLYLVFLWWVVVGNWMRAIPPFAEQRLITEGVIHGNAVICTLLVVLLPRSERALEVELRIQSGKSLVGVAVIGLVGMIAIVLAETAATRAMFGDSFAGHGGYHTRFGPQGGTGKPVPGINHP